MSLLGFIARSAATEWLDRALCGQRNEAIPPAVFDTEIWPGQGKHLNLAALDTAREICARCPVRAECGDWAMSNEVGLSGKRRHLLYAGLTPAQRGLVEARGDWSEESGFVDRGTDPIHFNTAYAIDGVRTVSEQGEDWTDRHTEVARDILAWVSVTVVNGQLLPAYRDLARIVHARDATVRRVLEALAEDGMVRGTEQGYVLVASPRKRAIANWQPLHVRESL